MIIKAFEKFKNIKKVHKDLERDKDGISEISDRMLKKEDPLEKLKNIVNKIARSLGCKSEVRYLNSGLYGMAFTVDNKVIKLTSDKGEAMISKELVGKNIPNIVKYYKVKKIDEYEIWAILMDKARKLTKEEKNIINIIDDNAYFDYEEHIDYTYDNLKKNSIIAKKGLDESYKEIKTIIDHSGLSMKLFKKLWKDYKMMCVNLINNGISIDDLHPGNIGYLNNDMVHFDISYQTTFKDISKIS